MTYIDENKFQFITDYSKQQFLTSNGQKQIIDFGSLSISERIILSAFMTIISRKKNFKNTEQLKTNIYQIIFNFNSEKRYVQTSYHDDFLTDLTDFITGKGLRFMSFIKDNYDKIQNDKTFIYRQQLNHTEMDILYSLKFQRNYRSLMNVLYIIGVAKSNIVTTKLNKISLDLIYKTSKTLSTRRVEEIFKKINSVSKNQVKYKIIENMLYFTSGFEIDEKKEFWSKQKKKFKQVINEEQILKSLQNDQNEIKQNKNIEQIKDQDIKEILDINIENSKDQKIKQKEKLNKLKQPEEKLSFEQMDELCKDCNMIDILNLGDRRLSQQLCYDYYIENYFKFQPKNKWDNEVARNKFNELLKITKNYTNQNSDDVAKLVRGEFIETLDKRKIAENKLNQMVNHILNFMDKLYDEDYQVYKELIFRVIRVFKEFIFYGIEK